MRQMELRNEEFADLIMMQIPDDADPEKTTNFSFSFTIHNSFLFEKRLPYNER